MRGRFITFEGGEGSGKTTQIDLLRRAFEQAAQPCMVTREPGGTPGAERIRGLLVDRDAESWEPLAETLLFLAARVEHVRKAVMPALASGTHVICDRFSDSTEVYQGAGRGLGSEIVRRLHALTLGSFQPNLTILLDIPPALGLRRAGERPGAETRFESAGQDFHARVREGFLAIAGREPERCVAVDATGAIAAVHAHIVAAVRDRLGVPVHAVEKEAAHD